MKKIGFFWGSTSDNTKDAAEFMQEYLEGEGYEVDSKDIGEVDVEDLLSYDKLLIGCPTWNIGELQDDQSLAILYSAVDVVVVPSLMETLPQVATEAQSCGIPVVAFNCTGLIDAVENFVTGYLAIPFDSQDLGRGIEWVLKNENYKKLSIESRKRALSLWNQKLIATQYEEIYKKVLD